MPPETLKLELLLEQLVRISAFTATKDTNLAVGAPLLERLGVDRTVIADVFNTTEDSVRAQISKANKLRPKQDKRGRSRASE